MRLQTLLWYAYMATGNILDTLVSDTHIYLRVAPKMLNHKGTSDHKETQLSRSNHMSVRTEATVYHSAANTVTDWGPNQGQALNSPPHVGFCILWQRYQCERDTFLNFSCDYEIQSWTSVQNYSTDKPCHRWAPFTTFQHCILCHAAWLQHPPSPLFMKGWYLLLLWVSECRGGSLRL